MKKCLTKYCRNEVRKHHNYCPKCIKRKQKQNNEVAYVFNLLKSNARCRKKEFLLTLIEFKTFCEETQYLKLRGKTGKSASIDRIR